MSEKYKIHNDENPYFVTFSLVEWVNLFHLYIYADIIIQSLKYCQNHYGLEIYGYCIMPSHIHLIIRSENKKLSAIVRDIKKFTSVEIIKTLKKEQDMNILLNIFSKAAISIKRNWYYKVWQDGYHPEEISSNKFLYQKLNYIHNNPIEKGLVMVAEDYLYSSARNYAELDALLEIILLSRQMRTY